MNDTYLKKQAVKNAVKWISEQLKQETAHSLNQLVDQAIFRFDLSPKEAEFLLWFYKTQWEDSLPKE